jgi:hypothetical protein
MKLFSTVVRHCGVESAGRKGVGKILGIDSFGNIGNRQSMGNEI